MADFEDHIIELGLVCDACWIQPTGSSGFELSITLEQVMEAFVDSLDMFAGETSSWLPTRLTYEGWLECLARCAVGLYGPLELLKLHQLLDCILRNVLNESNIEQAAKSVWAEARHSLASLAANATKPIAESAPKIVSKDDAGSTSKNKKRGESVVKGKKKADKQPSKKDRLTTPPVADGQLEGNTSGHDEKLDDAVRESSIKRDASLSMAAPDVPISDKDGTRATADDQTGEQTTEAQKLVDDQTGQKTTGAQELVDDIERNSGRNSSKQKTPASTKGSSGAPVTKLPQKVPSMDLDGLNASSTNGSQPKRSAPSTALPASKPAEPSLQGSLGHTASSTGGTQVGQGKSQALVVKKPIAPVSMTPSIESMSFASPEETQNFFRPPVNLRGEMQKLAMASDRTAGRSARSDASARRSESSSRYSDGSARLRTAGSSNEIVQTGCASGAGHC